MRAQTEQEGREAATEPSASTGTLGKAIAVLDIVASAESPLRFTDILRRTDQPRGTLHRQLTHLVSEGLLALNRDHSYALGLRLLKFASSAWSANRFRAIAEPHLHHLQEATGETVHLGVLNGLEVIYLDKVEARQAVRMYSQIGNSSPVYCTGVGKAAISTLADPALTDLARSIRYHRFTDSTLTSAEALLAEVEVIRRTGVAYDREEHEIGIRCVAAPIHTAGGGFIGGLSVTGPAYRVSDDRLQGWSGIVRKTADAITDDIMTRLGPRA